MALHAIAPVTGTTPNMSNGDYFNFVRNRAIKCTVGKSPHEGTAQSSDFITEEQRRFDYRGDRSVYLVDELDAEPRF